MPSRVFGLSSAPSPENPTLLSPAPVTEPQRAKKGLKSVLSFYSSASRASSPERRPSPSGPADVPSSKHNVPGTDEAQGRNSKSTLRERRSVDGSGSFTLSLSYRRKTARARASVSDIAFFTTEPSSSSTSTSVPSTPQKSSAAARTTLATPPLAHHAISLNSPESKQKKKTMLRTVDVPQERASRRKMARMEAQDGPWSVSVAESPYDKNSYSLYIKTPTHHMTLTRTGQEIQELHKKLQSAHPDATLPEIPALAQDDGEQLTDKKRKSSFLHTLSRLASPGPNRRERPRDTKVPNVPSSRNSVVSSTLVSPAQSTPSGTPTPAARESDNWDPFMAALTSPLDGSSATSTALAGYLTAVSNEQTLKHSKPWRRFVRIRTDDLISERVERAVKRVRSDLAAHLTGSKTHARKVDVPDDTSTVESAVILEAEDDAGPGAVAANQPEERSAGIIENIKEEEEEEDVRTAENGEGAKVDDSDAAAHDLPGTPRPSDSVTRGSIEIPEPESLESPKSVPTPTETNFSIASRIPRSQSADPDKASRMSRVFRDTEESAAESAAEYESETQVETEVEEGKSTTTVDDDSSVSTSGARRKSKRKSEKLVKKSKAAKKVIIDDFEMMRVLGKGCAGKVLLVRHKKSESLYALKAIMKRHVLAHQELQHTLTEQAVLKRMAREAKDPFVVKLWWSFHDKDNLFLVMDFHPGGDLATQLARWGRLGRDRARFYAAEIVEGVDGLHAAGVIYRDLKPENILIGADGHIVLTDFGLSKEFPRRSAPSLTAPASPAGSRTDFQQPLPHWMKGEEKGGTGWALGQGDTTTTFCGTAEYLAPEVIQGQAYSYEVDWWSFGTMLYEMLTGITPFWANNHSEMYVRVLQDELKFPDDRVMDQDTKSLIRGLLQRNPALRIKQPRIKRHPYFSMIDWSHVYYKRYIPPYIPPIDPSNASDTQNFDDTFLDMEPVIADENEQVTSADEHGDGERPDTESTPPSTVVQSRDPSVLPPQEDEEPDVFDGYSFKGRHSVIIDDDEDEGDVEEEGEVIDEEGDMERLANADLGEVAVEEQETPVPEEVEEPKTPEAKKPELPEAEVSQLTAAEEIAALHRAATAAVEKLDDETVAQEATAKKEAEEVARAAAATQAPPPDQALTKPPTSRLIVPVRTKPRKEKSGVAALDKYLSDGGDEDEGLATERDEDDDWDFIEAPGAGVEDRNGGRGTTLFARGVVDRYKLAVFRKSATPGKSVQRRNVSGVSLASDPPAADPSPSPSEKQRRGRNPGLTFRRHPRQFLRARSPEPPTASANGITKSLFQSSKSNGALSSANGAQSASAEAITPSTSLRPSTTAGPSLKSKESSTSMGSPSSDDQSLNGDVSNLNASGEVHTANLNGGASSPDVRRGAGAGDEAEKPKSKKLKKYKENAEKMLSIFASPR